MEARGLEPTLVVGPVRLGGPGGVGTCCGAPDALDEEPAGDTELMRERRALCLLSPGGFEFGGVLVDLDIIVGAERAMKEEAGEVGPDVVVVAEGCVVPWNGGLNGGFRFGLTLDWPGAVKLDKKESTWAGGEDGGTSLTLCAGETCWNC